MDLYFERCNRLMTQISKKETLNESFEKDFYLGEALSLGANACSFGEDKKR